MKNIIILLITFLIFGCSNPKQITLKKQIEIDWTDRNQLENHEIMYVQLNFDIFLDEEIAGKGIEDLMYKDSIYTLHAVDKTKLTKIILDSSNFGKGECGTFALNGGFLFIKNDTVKGIIEMGCGYSHWNFEPWNTNAPNVLLSDTGFEKMTKMLNEINSKKKK